MFDTALNDQFPSGAAAYAAYVDGGIGNQPNYAYIVSAFPKAQHLSIALFAATTRTHSTSRRARPSRPRFPAGTPGRFSAASRGRSSTRARPP